MKKKVHHKTLGLVVIKSVHVGNKSSTNHRKVPYLVCI